MLDIASFLVVAALAFLVFGTIGRNIDGGRLQRLLLLGVAIRLVGSTLRLEVMDRFYETGDWRSYFAWGQHYAEQLRSLDFSMFEVTGRWWGTQVVRRITGIVLTVIGPSLRGGFLVFSLFSFTGLVLIGMAFRNGVGQDSKAYLTWLLIWPSLWFWPASIGKDAVIVLAFGLTTYGYVGDGTRPRVIPLLIGLVLTASIRPHVATVLATAMACAEWLRRDRGDGAARWLRALVVFVIAAGVAYVGLSSLGDGDVDLINLEEQFEYRSMKTQQGGSEISTGSGLTLIPIALVNIFFRPFPWEASHVFMLVAAAETWAFWLFAFKRRRALRFALKNWRTNRLFAFSLPATLSLAMMYGAGFANLGIIARQRVVLLPFMFIIFGLSSVPSERLTAAPSRGKYPRPGPARYAD